MTDSPIPVTAARVIFSALKASSVSITTVFKCSFTNITGVAGMLAAFQTVILIPGTARPQPSASTTGKPIRAAVITGNRELTPPISPEMMASTLRPIVSSIRCTALTASSPETIFSVATVGAPIMALETTVASSSSSSSGIIVGEPNSRMAHFDTR